MRNDIRLRPTRPLLAGVALVLTVAGCQTVPVAPAPSLPWSVRRPSLQSLQRFGLDGRVAVAVGQQGFNAGIRWAQAGAVTRLVLTGPLGAGGVKVTADGADLTLITSSGKRLGADAARAELQDKLGFQPPLASVRYWVLGVPDPATPASVQLDSQQRPSELTQAGWQIIYTSYMPVGAQWLPRLVQGWQL